MKAVFAIVAALLLAACSTAGNGAFARFDAPQASALLVPGTTTRDDVRHAFGDGAVVHFDNGFETWQYLYREGIAKGWDDVPYIGLVTSRLDHPTKELVVLFDAQGVLRRWSLQQYDDRPPRPSARACPPEAAASLPSAGACAK